MQISLQDIRLLGYKKLYNIFFEESKFLDAKIQALSTVYCNLRIPAYSLLNKWNLVQNLNKEDIKGYSMLVHSLEPMIDIDNPSDSAKRKCRNTWGSIFENFGEASKLEKYEVVVLKDVGLKLPFIYANSISTNESNSDLEKLCKDCIIPRSDDLFDNLEVALDFYNYILIWAVFTQQESNFSKNNMSHLDVLSLLTSEKDIFLDSLLKIY